jgi:membrane-associated phospholipid phosphatase
VSVLPRRMRTARGGSAAEAAAEAGTGGPAAGAAAAPLLAAVERRRWDLVWLALGAAVLVLSALPVHAHSIAAAEASAFRLVNHLLSVPFAIVWAPMQLGNFLIVPVAVVAALCLRRWRLALGLAVAGAGAYLLAKQVKHFVLRGRPDSLLDDVLVRGAHPTGLGYVSGHIAVVTALAVVATPWLPRWGRWLVWTAVAAVFLARMYVGAHLPLDMMGGAALGLAAGAAVRLLLGTRAAPPHAPRWARGPRK